MQAGEQERYVGYERSYFEGFEAGYKLDHYKAWFHGTTQRFIQGRRRGYQSCLDIGCAYGYFMTGLKMKTKATLLVGIDLSVYAAKRAKLLTGSDIIVASALALPFRSGTFDLVTAVEVVEHLNDLSAHLLETLRVLTYQGVYFASSPNRFGTGRLLEILGLIRANPSHVELYAVRELRKRLRAAGFQRSYTHPFQMGVPLPKGMFVPLFFPSPFGSSIFACGQK